MKAGGLPNWILGGWLLRTVSESVLRWWKARAPKTKPGSRALVLSPSMPQPSRARLPPLQPGQQEGKQGRPEQWPRLAPEEPERGRQRHLVPGGSLAAAAAAAAARLLERARLEPAPAHPGRPCCLAPARVASLHCFAMVELQAGAASLSMAVQSTQGRAGFWGRGRCT